MSISTNNSDALDTLDNSDVSDNLDVSSNSNELVDFLEKPDTHENNDFNLSNDIFSKIYKENKITSDTPKTYISSTSLYFEHLMKIFKKKSESTSWGVSLIPKIHNKKIDGFFINFSKKFNA